MMLLLVSVALLTIVVDGHFMSRSHSQASHDTIGLHDAAKARGKYFGTATHNHWLHEDLPYYKQINNTHDFGQLVAEASMKWGQVQRTRGNFTFEDGDELANLASENDQLFRCHTLLWHLDTPSWVTEGGFDNATLVKVMKEHIATTVGHYKGKCYAWDVVNEAVVENGSYRNSVFYDTIGPAYIPIAFAAAAEADPGAKLYYNDFAIEVPGPKAAATVEIVKLIQSYGVKIDGIGLQGHVDLSGMPLEAHFELGSAPSYDDWVAVMKDYTDVVDEVAITEVDVSVLTPVTPENATIYDKQAESYYNATAACLTFEKCVGFTVWGFTDKYSWVPDVFPDMGDGHPWNRELVKKPAYYGILDAFTDFWPQNSSSYA